MIDLTKLPVREGGAGTFETEVHPVVDAVAVRASVVVVSMSDDDVAWFEKNCPGWREHISARRFDTQILVPTDDIKMAQMGRGRSTALAAAHKLGYMLGEEINSHLEPLFEGWR